MNHPNSKRRVVLAAAGAVAVFVVGWATGHRTAHHAPSPAPLTPPQATAPGAAVDAPMSVRSRAGAVAAARSANQVLSTRAVLETPTRVALFTRTAVPEATARFEAAYRRDLPRLRRSLALPTRGPLPVGLVMRSVSLGYRVASYTPDRARIALWTVLVLGNGVRVAPQAAWRSVEVALTWTAGGWRVADLTDTQGPTPALLGSPSPAGVFTDGQALYQPHAP